MFVVFALLAAAGWGSSDFAAGRASRNSSAVSVVVLTHLASFVALFAISLVPGQGGSPGGADLLWGLAAGFAGGAGAMLLFRGLGRGRMSVIAPVTATGAALVPVAVGLAQGDAVSSLGVLGVVLAISAILLVSLNGGEEPADDAGDAPAQPAMARTIVPGAPGVPLPPPPPGSLPLSTAPPPPPIPPYLRTPVVQPEAPVRGRASLRGLLRQPGMIDALLSGIGFGLFFVLIAQTSGDAGHWPLVLARMVSAAMFAVIAVMTFTPVFPDRVSRWPVVVAGLLDAVAAVCFVLSTRSGLLSVGAVLASLYPVATVVLARFVNGERVTRVQLGGLVLAGVAVSLLAV